MKLLPSPSISSSSSFGANLGTSCLSGILRRLLCSRRLPSDHDHHLTLPRDIINHQQEFIFDFEAATAPGIVARLMGLESFTDNPISLHWQHSISRSRSLNSPSHHRRKVKISTLSFPTFLEQENDDFLVLSFEKKHKTKRRKAQEKSLKNQNSLVLQNEEVGNFSGFCRGTTAEKPKFKRNMKITNRSKIQLEQVECTTSQDSSPVSVLDFDQFIVDASEEGASSRRKLSSRLDNYGLHDSLNIEDDLIPAERTTQETCRRSSKMVCHIQHDLDICCLDEEQDQLLLEHSIWTHNRVLKFKDFEDITAQLGLQIFNELLGELIDQLT